MKIWDGIKWCFSKAKNSFPFENQLFKYYKNNNELRFDFLRNYQYHFIVLLPYGYAIPYLIAHDESFWHVFGRDSIV